MNDNASVAWIGSLIELTWLTCIETQLRELKFFSVRRIKLLEYTFSDPCIRSKPELDSVLYLFSSRNCIPVPGIEFHSSMGTLTLIAQGWKIALRILTLSYSYSSTRILVRDRVAHFHVLPCDRIELVYWQPYRCYWSWNISQSLPVGFVNRIFFVMVKNLGIPE